MTFEEEFALLSAQCKNSIRGGNISQYSDTLREMAYLLLENDRFVESVPILFTSFYIDLSGFARAAYIDPFGLELLSKVAAHDEIELNKLEQLFYASVQAELISQHPLSIKECWFLLRLCLEGRADQANYILSKI